MARPQKIGLDYFPLDVDIDQDDKVALIEAKYGLLGFGIVVKIFMKIYNNGYFYEWTEKEQLLLSKRVNVDINELNDVIADCLKWDLFDSGLYESHNILTSKGIQKRYLEATTRRKKVEIEGELLLLDVNEYKNILIVNTNPINDNINPQSKVKESKGKESKVKNNIASTLETEFGRPVSKTEVEKLEFFVEQDMDTVVVIEAIKRAKLQGKPHVSYVDGILKNWLASNIKTIESVKLADAEYEKKKPGKQQIQKPGREPPISDKYLKIYQEGG